MGIKTFFLSGAIFQFAFTANAEKFSPVTFTSGVVFSVTGEASECSYGLAEQDALYRASTLCSPIPATQVTPFRYRRIRTYGVVFATAEFQCDSFSPAIDPQNEGVICEKVGTTYVVKCCDRATGACWIE